ncbi:hypothetical protein PHAVU_005G179700, partial [Phaseolus vulgaris]
ICLALCVSTNNSAWFGTAVFVTNMRNFPLSRGTISGILNGYGGISAEVYTLIYSLVLKGSASKLLLFLTIGLPAVCLVMMFFIRPFTPPSEEKTLQCIFHESGDVSDVEMLIAGGQGAVREKRRHKRGDDFKFREAFIKADFWLCWFAYFLGAGSGVTVLNNLAQIGVALGVEDTTMLLSVFSFCNFIGRLDAGVVSEYFVSILFYAYALDGSLYAAATALLSICYGVQCSIMAPTVSEIFGLKHFGVISSFMMLGNPIGALIFSVFLAANVYDTEAAKQGNSTCYGADFFRR